MRCRVCGHSKRADIEKACSHLAIDEVARKFGLSANALERHVAMHDPATPPTSGVFPIDDALPETLRSGVAA